MNPEANRDVIRFQIDTPVPPLFSVRFGEVVHQVRSALDHTACFLVDAAGHPVTNTTAFPVKLTEGAWIGDVEFPQDRCGNKIGGPLKGIDPTGNVWALIKKTQPYQAGKGAKDQPLAVLEDLWNRDKHRILNATHFFPDPNVLLDLFAWDPPVEPIERRAPFTRGKPLYHNAVIAVLRFPPGPMPRVYVKRPLTMDIAFGDPTLERGHMRDTIAFVRRVVKDLVSLT